MGRARTRRTRGAGELEVEHAETLEKMRSILRSLELQGFQLVIPLFFRRQCSGYIVLGRKQNGAGYDVNEVKILESFRLPMAMAIRNAVLYEQIKRLRGRAEAKVCRLSDYFRDMGEVVKHRMVARTLIFASDCMAYLFELAQKYAKQTRQAVLVTGPTGTGKKLIAQAIHEHGSGADAPFVAVNCAAVPAGLWETEIFGFEKGAFTDARSAHEGRVEQAAGGTLFFDEIGEMPLGMQPKMLRLL